MFSLLSPEIVANLSVFEKNLLSEYLSANPDTDLNRIESLLKSSFPVEYITSYTYFYGLKVKVSPKVLIPRVETEQLVQKAINAVSTDCTLIDVGTGSGAIMHSIGSELDNKVNIRAIGIDISKKALSVAKSNTPTNSNTVSYEYIEGEFIPDIVLETIDTSKPVIITANLPYIALTDPTVSPKTLKYEPKEALFSRFGYTHTVNLLELIAKKRLNFEFLGLEISPIIVRKVKTSAKALFPQKNMIVAKDCYGETRFVFLGSNI